MVIKIVNIILNKLKIKLKKEKWSLAFKQTQVIIIIIIILLILTGISTIYLLYKQEVQNKYYSNLYEKSTFFIKEKKIKEYLSTIKELQEEANKYTTLSNLITVSIIQNNLYINKSTTKKDTAYDLLINSSQKEPSFKELAIILKAWSMIEQKLNKDITKKLISIKKSKSIWRSLAGEILGLNAIKLGNIKKAKEIFKKILKDHTSSKKTKYRISIILNYL